MNVAAEPPAPFSSEMPAPLADRAPLAPAEARLEAPTGTAREVPRVATKAVRARRFVFVLAALVALLVRPAREHAAAAELLGRFANPKAEVATVDVEEVSVAAPRGAVRAKLYAPRGRSGLPGVVLVHGVHYRGIDEARLSRFAASLADTGLVVLTPEIAELADYHVDPRSIDTVGASLSMLAARTGRAKVGLMGMSFGGGIALLAAARPDLRDKVGFVVAVGAHDDLARTLRFFATSTIGLPDGTSRAQKAHDYGAMVLVYNRVDDFFPLEDREPARLALRAWLQEKRDLAREVQKSASPASQKKLEEIFTTDLHGLRADLLAIVKAHEGEDTGVSPHGHLGGLEAPVFLLHGADDSVIPSSETLWLARDVPPGLLRQAVVSPAIRHVEVEGEPTYAEQWELLHFMGEILAEANRL